MPFLLALSATALLAACSGLPGLQPSPSVSPTAPPPSATPVPLAARVNGEGIHLAVFEAEVARYEASQTALGTDLATLGDYRGLVLESLIDQVLLAQGARAAGQSVEEADVATRFEELAEQAGGPEAMGGWLAANGYTPETFEVALAQEMLAQAMVQEIIQEMGNDAEQVHARHILVATRDQAEELRLRILAGEDFALLARQRTLDLSTRPAGGDLGWFPRGVLLAPEVEAAAFELQDGSISDVVESSLGFHLVQPLERGIRPLSPTALTQLRQAAVQAWLAEQRASSLVEILITP